MIFKKAKNIYYSINEDFNFDELDLKDSANGYSARLTTGII